MPDRGLLELAPLPEVPALAVAPGTFPGIPSGPLAVVVSRPQGQLRGNERPTITFNKPVVPLGAATADHPTPATLNPPVDGEWRWLGSASAEFVPRAPFPYASTVVVTVNPTLKSLDGQALAEPVSFSFQTLPPELDDVEPRRNWPWLDPEKGIRLTFNQPVEGLERAQLLVDDVLASFVVKDVIDVDAERAQHEHRPPRGRTTFGRPTRYELALKSKVLPSATLRLVLDGVRGREGTATMNGVDVRWRARGPFGFQGARFCVFDGGRCPQGPLVLVATGEVDVETLKARLHVRPVAEAAASTEVALNLDELAMTYNDSEWPTNGHWTLVVDGAFQPGRSYSVIVDAGVKDDAGQEAPAFAVTARTTDVEPWLRIPTPIVLLEGDGDGTLPVETANVPTVQTRVWPQDLSSLARFLARDDFSRAPEGAPVEGELPVAGARNNFVRTPWPLRSTLPASGPKLFVAEVWANTTKETAERQRVVGQITDLAAHAKLGATAGLVWVTSLKTGQPVADAVVAVWDRAGKKRHEVQTDADGLARLPGAGAMLGTDGDSENDWFVPWALVSATRGDDTGVTLSSWRGDYGWSPSAWDGDVPNVEAIVFSERGIYRPGESVFLKGIVRTRVRGALAVPPPDSEFVVNLTDGNSGNKQQRRVPVSRFGTFDATFKLPSAAPLGWWAVDVAAQLKGRPVRAGTSFRVEEYRPPQFKVDVEAPTRSVLSGERLQAVVQARYLFGAPMSGAAVEATVSRSPAWFSPPGMSGYAFGVEIDGWSDTEREPGSDTFARVTGVVGADGAFVVDAGVVEATAGRAWTYSVEANVTDVSRQAVAGSSSTVVHPASVYAGVRVPDGFGVVGTASELRLVAVDLEGKQVAGRPLDVVVKRRDWKNSKRRNDWDGMFVQYTEPVDVDVGGCPRLRSGTEAVVCAFTPEKPGLHVVEATVTDDAGRAQRTRTFFYVTGGGWVSWRRGEDDSIELVADKKEYAPGDTARVIVKSPWPAAEAVVTVEREGVRSARRVKLLGAAQAVDVPLTDDDLPNVFVSVVMVRGRVDDNAARDAGGRPGEVDPGRPQVRVGTLNLPVRSTKKKLAVALAAGSGSARPGQKLQLQLGVKDHAGRGVPAEITIWAVDEAVLRLTSYAPPDLVSQFHPQRGLSVRLGEPLIHLVRRRTYGTKGEPGGDGDDGAASGFRSDFKTTAWFLPGVVTDAEGKASVEVKLPDDLTTYRVMAVAVSTDDRFGDARADVVVQKPVMALPALPRFARVGDRFEAGVVVHAMSEGDVDVTAAVDGAEVALDGAAHRTVHLAGRGVEVRFPFVARKDGRASLRFVAKKAGGGADDQDGVLLKLPVLLPVVVETTAVSGMTDAQRQEALQPPAASRPDTGGLEVTLSSTALAGTREAMRQLVEYPHGCAEQLASKLVPFLALRELQGGFGEAHAQGSDEAIAQAAAWLGPQILDEAGQAHPDRVIATTVQRLQGLQDPSGGFRVWPGSACVDAEASAWATLALSRAREVGFDVDTAVLGRAIAFLRERVLADRMPTCSSFTPQVTTDQRVLAGFVLSRARQPRVAPLQQIAQDVLRRPDSLPLFSRALLVDALVVGHGDARLSQQVLQTVLNAARETPREVHFEEPEGARHASAWSSDVRTTAVVLMTLAVASPEHPFVPRLASYLEGVRDKSGRYRTTQEAAWALMAFSELVRARERTPPSFAADVTLGGQSLVKSEFRGRSLDVGLHLVPMADLVARGEQALPFVFQKEGTGTLYYSAVLRRAPLVVPTTSLDRGFVVQRFFEPIDDPSRQGRRFFAGDLVRIRVRVATRDARRDVAIDVPLPAGLEAVDTTLATTARAGRVQDTTSSRGEEGGEDGEDADDGGDEGVDGAGFFWSPFVSVEKRDDRISAYADDLPPGVHTLTFVARATTMGSFALLPAEASEMYTPEVYGRSDGGAFDVVAPPTP